MTLHPFSPTHLSHTAVDPRPTHARIRLRILKQYQQEPILSELIRQHQLTVNINAALLSANGRDDGWFDLDLRGSAAQINSALIYLNDLDLEVWYETNGDETW